MFPKAGSKGVELAEGPSRVTPAETVSIARRLLTHRWKAEDRNILHGPDADGVVVHTPDVGYRPGSRRAGWWRTDAVNVGIPYKWGGFDDPESFDKAVAGGAAAGDVYSFAKRLADNAAVSRHAVGLDCSGFISRCLKLPEPYDTSQLPALCGHLSDVGICSLGTC